MSQSESRLASCLAKSLNFSPRRVTSSTEVNTGLTKSNKPVLWTSTLPRNISDCCATLTNVHASPA